MNILKTLGLSDQAIAYQKRHERFLSHLCLVSVGASALYVGIDLFGGTTTTYKLHGVTFFISLMAYFLNRKGAYYLAIAAINLGTNLSIYIFASSGHEGAYLVYLPVCVAVLLFYGFEYLHISIILSLFSVMLFFIGELFPIDYVDLNRMPEWYRYAAVSMNFMIAFTCIMLIVGFMLRTNHNAHLQLQMANEDLKKHKQKLELAIKVNKSGVFEWDLKHNEVSLPESTNILLGYASEAKPVIPELDFFKRIHTDDLKHCNTTINGITKASNTFSIEVRIKNQEGVYRWFIIGGQMYFEHDESPSKIIGTLSDINDRKVKEDKVIQESTSLKEEKVVLDNILYSTTHDIRGPLSAIKGLVEMSNYTDDINQVKEYMDLIKNKVEHLDDFVQDMLDMSYNSNTQLDKERVELLPLINSIVRTVKGYPEFSNIKYEIDVGANLILNLDRKRLKIVLNNLISNGSKYNNGSDQAFVKISAYQSAVNTMIKIEDNGIGISSEHLNKIFDMFYRANVEKAGSGVGLYIVKETVSKLEGDIRVVSRPAHGTTVELMLPL